MLSTFIDIEGAFNNTPYDIINKSLDHIQLDKITKGWITVMLQERQVITKLEEETFTFKPTKGCPQGGVISPLTIVADSLIRRLIDF